MALFCNLDYAGLCCKAHFSPKSPRTRFGAFCPLLPFLLHLIVKTGFMSLKYFLNRHHFSSISRRLSVNARHFLKKTLDISQKISDVSPKTWEIFQISLDFFQKTSEFFSVPSEGRFLTANRNTKKQEMEELQA